MFIDCNYKKLIFLIATLIPIALCAQKANFKSFGAVFEGKPGIIEVDLSLKKVGPISSQPFITSIGIKIFNCDKNGLPEKSELEVINRISTEVQTLFGKVIAYTHAGTFVKNCVCLDYFFVSDTVGLREKLTVLYKEKFSDRTLGLKIKEDKTWDTYFNFLYPGEAYERLREPIFVEFD